MRGLLLALVLALVLAGCASTPLPLTYHHWVKAGGSMPMLNTDWRDCTAANSDASRVVSGGDETPEVVHVDRLDWDRAADCMKARGWTLTGKDNSPS
jgi:hypothetical protein